MMTTYETLTEMRQEEDDMARGWLGPLFRKVSARRIKALNIAMDNLSVADAEKELG
jgi:hypothetical protein